MKHKPPALQKGNYPELSYQYSLTTDVYFKKERCASQTEYTPK